MMFSNKESLLKIVIDSTVKEIAQYQEEIVNLEEQLNYLYFCLNNKVYGNLRAKRQIKKKIKSLKIEIRNYILIIRHNQKSLIKVLMED